ncbi:J domain-containing protein [Anabaenopsis arnoldii]|uniref:DnaJ domain-containing protein n=1 Tax=Anabaenopsis arnoldii TaxID=2152938 RepID=A0ABT5ARC5_9CYAN|nr:DnaJ domain-containing protein [Anabaenopsis arnoldii]MDB9539830.1 DnaJ domain-containing protein [Anabaenopsis arnoldii]MDH6092135.1 DnaJ domain-containing protein [Anabaenopsis arnoldii]
MENKEDYYKILEITPKATFQEIKAAYRLLCQEYHPDKMPPGTPAKARKYVEERFKQLNEAYSTLSDPEKRRQYDLSYYTDVDSSQNNTSKVSTVNNVFNPEKMQQVAERLEGLKGKIEAEYQQRQKQIDLSVKNQLDALRYNQEDWAKYTKENLEGFTVGQKITNCLLFIFVAFFGLPFGLIGLLWTGFWLLVCLVGVLSPTINTRAAEQIKTIKNQADADKFDAKNKRENQLNNLNTYQRKRIKFFKSIAIEILSEDYIASLSDEDQFYLLKAIQERKDAENLSETLKTATKVVVGIGIVAAMFGLGIGIGRS